MSDIPTITEPFRAFIGGECPHMDDLLSHLREQAGDSDHCQINFPFVLGSKTFSQLTRDDFKGDGLEEHDGIKFSVLADILNSAAQQWQKKHPNIRVYGAHIDIRYHLLDKIAQFGSDAHFELDMPDVEGVKGYVRSVATTLSPTRIIETYPLSPFKFFRGMYPFTRDTFVENHGMQSRTGEWAHFCKYSHMHKGRELEGERLFVIVDFSLSDDYTPEYPGPSLLRDRRALKDFKLAV